MFAHNLQRALRYLEGVTIESSECTKDLQAMLTQVPQTSEIIKLANRLVDLDTCNTQTRQAVTRVFNKLFPETGEFNYN